MASHPLPLIRHRPFRAPHHTISHAGLVGGGRWPRPGEVSLAHRGVLFLDELPEFGTRNLETLRQPVEDKVVTISRASGTLTDDDYKTTFLPMKAEYMNPQGDLYRVVEALKVEEIDDRVLQRLLAVRKIERHRPLGALHQRRRHIGQLRYRLFEHGGFAQRRAHE